MYLVGRPCLRLLASQIFLASGEKGMSAQDRAGGGAAAGVMITEGEIVLGAANDIDSPVLLERSTVGSEVKVGAGARDRGASV